jgi:hypothetical protein
MCAEGVRAVFNHMSGIYRRQGGLGTIRPPVLHGTAAIGAGPRGSTLSGPVCVL